jgi:hypothetical protein
MPLRLYKINLSDPEVTAEIHQRLPDGRMVRVPTRMRNIELEVLDKCFEVLSVNCRTLSDYVQCVRIMIQMQTLPDRVRSIQLKKSDMENLINGFVLTAGKRPESWSRAVKFFEQLLAPEEINIVEEQ